VSEPSGPVTAADIPSDATATAVDFSATGVRFPRWAVAAGHLLLLSHCVRRLALLRNPMVQLVFLRQVYFVGVAGLPVITLLALATGALMVTQATSVLGAGNSYLYVMLVWTLVTEAAPLFVAVVVIGRSATVISTELALMKVRGEMRHMEHMRIDPRDYLVLPRIMAFTVSLLVATFYYQIVSVTGGFAASTLLLDVSFVEQMQRMLEAISATAFALTGAKTALFGLAIGTIACFAGIYAGDTINDVPRAQIVAYLRSLTWLVVIDLLFALATFGSFA
jgi:phospholipid/cholesterol/gamma-HCH transport system permease protein